MPQTGPCLSLYLVSPPPAPLFTLLHFGLLSFTHLRAFCSFVVWNIPRSLCYWILFFFFFMVDSNVIFIDRSLLNILVNTTLSLSTLIAVLCCTLEFLPSEMILFMFPLSFQTINSMQAQTLLCLSLYPCYLEEYVEHSRFKYFKK